MDKNVTELLNLLKTAEGVKSLESKKTSLSNEIEQMKKDFDTYKSEGEKQLLKEREEARRESNLRNRELDKREAELKRKEEDVIAKDVDSKLLEEGWDKLKEEKVELARLKKETEKARIEYLDKAKLAGLKIEQKKLEKIIPAKKGKKK